MTAAEPDAVPSEATGRDQGSERKKGKSGKRVAIFCEPSPISHVSGMKERFSCLIKGLKAAGDDVLLVTPDSSSQPPKEYLGAKVLNVLGFPLPLYKSPTLLLSSGLSLRVFWHLMHNRPDVIHVTTPGLLVFAATLYSRLLNIPLVMSYHTHIPDYIPKYTWQGLVSPMWSIIQWCTRAADLTLVPSSAMKDEMVSHQCQHGNMEVWQRAVDTERFNPRFRSLEMRSSMSDGHPEAPLLVYVGRLGAEKNLESIRHVLEANPTARLAFVGDGPARPDLEAHFAGLPVKFMGMMKGEALSQAYASADIFVMPSMTETLGFVVLEAMASGLAVVSVASLGLIDIVSKPGINGFLYPPGDYDKAASQVATLIEQPELQQAMALAARAEAESLSWQAAVHKIRTKQYTRAIRMFNHKRRAAVLALNKRMTNALTVARFPLKAFTRLCVNTYSLMARPTRKAA